MRCLDIRLLLLSLLPNYCSGFMQIMVIIGSGYNPIFIQLEMHTNRFEITSQWNISLDQILFRARKRGYRISSISGADSTRLSAPETEIVDAQVVLHRSPILRRRWRF